MKQYVRSQEGAKLNFEGAVIKEQGITFAVVIVKEYIIDNRLEADKMIQSFRNQIFRGLPVVLMAQNSRGVPRYYGRKDIVNFLTHIHPSRIPWKRYTIS